MLYQPLDQQVYDPEKGGFRYEDVTFQAADGVALHGWYFKSTVQKEPKALLVFFHGNGENMSTHFVTLSWLLDYGYDFFIFDYRGYGSSQGDPTPEGTVKDGIAAINYAGTRALKSQTKYPLVVFAQSLGGAVALRSLIDMKKAPGNTVWPKLIVVDSSFLSYKAAARAVLAHSWITWILQPFTYLVLSDEWAPGDAVKSLAPTPLVVMHGDKDQLVDYSLGLDLFDKAGEPKEFWKIEGGKHIDSFWRHGDVYRTKLLNRLKDL